VTSDTTLGESPTRTSRRDLIKKTAVGVGVAWTAPALLTTVAYAQGTSPDDVNCPEVGSNTCNPSESNPPDTSCLYRAQYGRTSTNPDISPFGPGVSGGSMVRYSPGSEENGQGCNPNSWNNTCSYPTTGGLVGTWTLDADGIHRTVVFDLPVTNNCCFRDTPLYVRSDTTRNGAANCVPKAEGDTTNGYPLYSLPDTRYTYYPVDPSTEPCDPVNHRFKRVTFPGGTSGSNINGDNAGAQAYTMFRMVIQCIQNGGVDLCP